VRDAEGRHQRRLGLAWVKDSGKRTPRGAVKWVARDGTAPDGYLTPAVAEDMLRELLAASPKQRRPASPPPSRTPMTLRQACDAWLRSAEHETEIKHSTLTDYRNVADRLCRDLGASTSASALTPDRISRYLTDLQAERWVSIDMARSKRDSGATVRRMPNGRYVVVTPASARTREKYRTALNGAMACAVELGAIEANPIASIKRTRRARRRRRTAALTTSRFLRPAEVRALVQAASEHEPQDATMFLTMAFCGLRLGEVLDLRWGAVNFDGSSLLIESNFVRDRRDTPKSGIARMVPMAPEVADALATHAQRLPVVADASLVFVGKRGGHVDANRFRLRFYAALTAADVKRIRLHDLRHTFGTVCAAAGIPQTTLKEWMGHADLATTEIYTAYYPQASDAAKISAAFAKQSAIDLMP
jgi:integrase